MILFFFAFWLSAAEYSIVFVHIGNTIPSYTLDAIHQARLFNKNCPIYLLGNQRALLSLGQAAKECKMVSLESLSQTADHRIFIQQDRHNGLFRYANERFFYLEEFVRSAGLTQVFHLENDVMLYADLEEFLPLFQKIYQGKMGATFDSDQRCIPGFVYFSDPGVLQKLTQFIASQTRTGMNDMALLSRFKDNNRASADYLPILPPSYAARFLLSNDLGQVALDPSVFFSHFDQFQSIFDAACIGQYWGGIDPIHRNSKPGFINETSFLHPQNCSLEWREDAEGRMVPFLGIGGNQFRINNLHIHSKNLIAFSSDNPRPLEPP